MRAFAVFLLGILLGALSWGAAYLVSGTFEPFDNSTGFFVCQAVLAVFALAIGLRDQHWPLRGNVRLWNRNEKAGIDLDTEFRHALVVSRG